MIGCHESDGNGDANSQVDNSMLAEIAAGLGGENFCKNVSLVMQGPRMALYSLMTSDEQICLTNAYNQIELQNAD